MKNCISDSCIELNRTKFNMIKFELINRLRIKYKLRMIKVNNDENINEITF